MTEGLTASELGREMQLAVQEIMDTRADTPAVKRLLSATHDAQAMQRAAATEVLELNDRLLAIIAEQAAVLEAVQWSATNAMGEDACPRCSAGRGLGHAPSCDLFGLSDVERVDGRLGEAAGMEDV